VPQDEAGRRRVAEIEATEAETNATLTRLSETVRIFFADIGTGGGTGTRKPRGIQTFVSTALAPVTALASWKQGDGTAILAMGDEQGGILLQKIETTEMETEPSTSSATNGNNNHNASNSSNNTNNDNDNDNDNEPHLPTKVRLQEPWTFVHRERPGAPATLLSNTLSSTHLRAWDFCDGQAFCSKEPIVFSFSEEPGDRRQFMKISTSAQEAQQFHAPGEGGILGMGVNAIVHRVELKSTSPKSLEDEDEVNLNESGIEEWDAAVKRPFSLSKMLASLEAGSEAALGKRLRQLSNRSLLNSDGRVLYFYGLGVALSSNASRPTEYKFEATILARYEEEFSTYTMKRFMQDYTSKETPSPRNGDMEGDGNDDDWRKDFSLISVKVLLVSLLNAFRDLTLMGVQAFDFNHLGNVLISRDHQSVKLLDIDGDRKGSIPLSEYLDESSISLESQSQPFKTSVRQTGRILHKPSLDVDLNAVLPTVVQQLLLGKGRGTSFVVNSKSEIWRLTPHEAKVVVKEIISENFGPLMDSHMAKVVEWFYAMLKKQPPWGNWTHDIYDAMRCIDHLPVR